MNTTAEKAIEILKQYAKESGTTVRSTSDLSPMEEWLIAQLKAEQPTKDETEIESLLGKLDSANEEISYWKNKSKVVPVHIGCCRDCGGTKLVEAEAMKLPAIKQALVNETVKRAIYVPNRILNLVV